LRVGDDTPARERDQVASAGQLGARRSRLMTLSPTNANVLEAGKIPLHNIATTPDHMQWRKPQGLRRDARATSTTAQAQRGSSKHGRSRTAELEREGQSYLVVDNQDDYCEIGKELVTTPGEISTGLQAATLRSELPSRRPTPTRRLNDGTRISKGICRRPIDPRLPAGTL
jgi:hypothetical protein